MIDFELAYKKVMKAEGFYSNNPNDSGGETLYGISRKKGAPFPEFWKIVDQYKQKSNFPENMRKDQQLISMKYSWYKANYWTIIRINELNHQGLAEKLFDISVNKGPGRAGQFMAELAGVKWEGKVTNYIIKYLNENERIVDK